METNNKIAEINKMIKANRNCISLLTNDSILKTILDKEERIGLIAKLIIQNIKLYEELGKINNKHKHNNNKHDSKKTFLSKTIGTMIPIKNKNGVELINVSNENNNKINVATYIKDNRCTGISKCNPEDVFDLEIGFCVAFARAVLGENYKDVIKDVKNNLIIKD